MRKKVVLAASAMAISAGSIFAFSANGSESVVVKKSTEQCPPDCCGGSGCEPGHCDKTGDDCCDK
jgi:hypothetical protein